MTHTILFYCRKPDFNAELGSFDLLKDPVDKNFLGNKSIQLLYEQMHCSRWVVLNWIVRLVLRQQLLSIVNSNVLPIDQIIICRQTVLLIDFTQESCEPCFVVNAGHCGIPKLEVQNVPKFKGFIRVRYFELVAFGNRDSVAEVFFGPGIPIEYTPNLVIFIFLAEHFGILDDLAGVSA